MSSMAGRTMNTGYPPGTVMPYSSYGSPGAYLRPSNLPGKRSLYVSEVTADGCCSGQQRQSRFELGKCSVNAKGTASQTEAVWSCTLGGKPSVRNCHQ